MTREIKIKDIIVKFIWRKFKSELYQLFLADLDKNFPPNQEPKEQSLRFIEKRNDGFYRVEIAYYPDTEVKIYQNKILTYVKTR